MPQKTIKNLLKGLNVLKKYASDFSLVPVPNSYPNGTPAFLHRAYLHVQVPFENQLLADRDLATLGSLGWYMDGDGWSFPGW